MLVHLKEPMAISTIEGYTVYGRFYARGSFGPTNVPRDVFLKNRNVLDELVITREWFKKKTGKDFPIDFAPSELVKVDLDTTIEIAHLLGIKYIKSKKITDRQKAALRRAIIRKIDSM